MPGFAVSGYPRSVRTCFVCNRRRFPPAFVTVYHREGDAVYAICEGCLEGPGAEERIQDYLHKTGDGSTFWNYYVLGEGSRAAELIVPRLSEAQAKGQIITRNLRDLADGRKAFWKRVRGGPAPRGASEHFRGRTLWSETVWEAEG